MKNSKNQRKDIRIKDQVLLRYKPIPEHDCQLLIEQIMDGQNVFWGQEAVPHFRRIDGFLKKIRSENDSLANVLEVLDQKLNFIIGQLIEMSGEDDKTMGQLASVDISASGMGFLSSETFELGQNLEMTIGLLPEHYFFRVFAKIIRTEPRQDQWFNAVEFLWISEETREKLIEHIFSRQLQQLRMRRLKKEMEGEC